MFLYRRRLLRQDAHQHRRDMIGDEGRLAGQTLIEHATERKQVGRRGQRPYAARLFRSHILRRTHHHSGVSHGVRRSDATRDAKVQELGTADIAADQKEVGGLEIAMNDAALVRPGEGGEDLRQEGQAVGQRQRAAQEPQPKVFPVQPLHGEEMLALGCLTMSNMSDDARVVQLRQDLGFASEALPLIGPCGAGVPELEGDELAAMKVAGAIDGAHAAAACGAIDDEAVGKEAARYEAQVPHRTQYDRGRSR